MPFFYLRIRWAESPGPKSDELGHRILKSDFVPSDLATSDCIRRPILFSDRKVKIRSSESDRIRISLSDTFFWKTDFAKNRTSENSICPTLQHKRLFFAPFLLTCIGFLLLASISVFFYCGFVIAFTFQLNS